MSRTRWVTPKWVVLSLAVGMAACIHTRTDFIPIEGDLLFQDLDSAPLCDAIEKVTLGIDGAKFCHVGIATLDGRGAPQVIEAYDMVAVRPLGEFLGRARDDAGRPRVVVGRLKESYRSVVPVAIRRARKLIGASYNRLFLPDNGRYYCSELVWECFRDTAGRPLFELAPMTFKEPNRSEPMAVWKDYFAKLGVPVPEGVPGCNPGGLSRSDKLVIVYAYGRPRGWTEEIWRGYAERVKRAAVLLRNLPVRQCSELGKASG